MHPRQLGFTRLLVLEFFYHQSLSTPLWARSGRGCTCPIAGEACGWGAGRLENPSRPLDRAVPEKKEELENVQNHKAIKPINT